MPDMSKPTFVKETFWRLLCRNGGVVVPIIQRAYTLGGRGFGGHEDRRVKKIGLAFIECLVNALLGDKAIELDFIYGVTESGCVQPLDGQQRLTTLFLLHWYVAQKENVLTEDVKSVLKKFTYETRVSSRRFCEILCEHIVERNSSLCERFRDTLEDQKWFLLSWKSDPTVLSMLGMLDMMHERLKDVPGGLWALLTQEPDKAPITFFYMPLESFGLTDDLYLKMNARGKGLTEFEKIKAEFSKKIDGEKWDMGKSFLESFGHKIDTEWMDLFWEFRDETNSIDAYLLCFISSVLITHYAGKNESRTIRLFNAPSSVLPDDLEKDAYDRLCESLDLFTRAWKELDKVCDAKFWMQGIDDDGSFRSFFSVFIAKQRKMLWKECLVFHGFSVYLRNTPLLDAAKLSDWLRFVRDIVENTEVGDYKSFVSAKALLDELAFGSTDIYAWLRQHTVQSKFAARQMAEEYVKAWLYANSPKAKPIIQNMEDCNFCRGRVRFILECLRVYDAKRINSLKRLKKMRDVLYAHLDGDDVSNDFRRGLLIIRDRCFYKYWEAHVRTDGSIKGRQYCLICAEEAKTSIHALADHKRYGEYLKSLLILLLAKPLKQVLNQFVCPDHMPEWQRKLIYEKKVLDDDDARFIIVGENGKVYTRKAKKSWRPKEIA